MRYFASSRLSRSASVRVHVIVRNEHGRARGVGAAPRSRHSNEAILPRILVPRTTYLGRDENKLLTESLKQRNDIVYMYMFLLVQTTHLKSKSARVITFLRNRYHVIIFLAIHEVALIHPPPPPPPRPTPPPSPPPARSPRSSTTRTASPCIYAT